MKTADVRAALRGRFIAPEWSLFFEVGDATGTRQSRWADAVAMNLYPSRGLELHGFEIKVSRSDWLRELKDPEKSAPVQRYCDRWWIICPDGVIKPGELPPTWGHYEVKPGGTIRQVVAAPKLDAQPVTKEFMAALVRRAGAVDEEEVKALVRTEVERQRASDRDNIEREIKMRSSDSARAIEQLAEIKEACGLEPHEWISSAELGLAVAYVMKAGVLGAYSDITHMRNLAEQFTKRCDEAMAGMPTAKAKARSR